tara:strand:- start:22521 stop:23267 length:747 start_codon:yes stop_codon:yes gene_type:complete
MQQIFKPLALLALMISFVSCGGQKPMVDDIKVSPYYENDELMISLAADLSIGNVSLPQASFPIIHPKTGEEIGLVSMVNLGANQNLLDLVVNVSAISNLNSNIAKLPNGAVLPLIGNNRSIIIPIGPKVELYLSIGDGKVALGVSIPFKTLDAVGRKVGTSALFPVFNKNEIYGAAGLYLSKEAGKNGFGLFADVTNKLDDIMFLDITRRDDIQTLDYNAVIPASRTESKINSEMLKMHRRSKQLRIN